MWTMLLFTAWTLVSCSDDENTTELPTQVEAPEIIQSEEISDNPITLAFSWKVVDNAESYSYVLAAIKESGNETITQGNTTELNIEIVSTREAELFYSTEYLFSIKAIAEDKTESAASEVRVTTSGGAIALSIENLTYRSALLKGVPVDKSMLYQFAQVPMEKYTAYNSDMEFIEGYDYGYYQAMGAAMPWIPWYGLMQEGSQQGDYEYHTKILKPETDYLFYAYGVEFDMSNAEDPVKVITPMIKHPFTTPAWEATSNCTFDVSIESQQIDQDGYIVISVKVVPSDKSVNTTWRSRPGSRLKLPMRTISTTMHSKPYTTRRFTAVSETGLPPSTSPRERLSLPRRSSAGASIRRPSIGFWYSA